MCPTRVSALPGIGFTVFFTHTMQQLKRSLLLFVTVMAVYLLSVLYLSQPVRLALMTLIFIALAADLYRTLRQSASVLRRPQRLPLLWSVYIVLALATGAGYVGLQTLLDSQARTYTGCQDFFDAGVMMACGMLITDGLITLSGTKAIQPQK